MKKPLIISDCDEVLLHMVVPFRDWLDESQGVRFHMEGGDFANALRWKSNDEPLEQKDVWRMLGAFFDTEMGRQTPIAGSVNAINTLAEHADVVVLTNLNDDRRDKRAVQLAEHGIDVPVFTNQGPKGPALAAILEQYDPSHAIFIDDLHQHHNSVKGTAQHVTRLHFCGEPLLASQITCANEAGDAHARIDDWDAALPWLLDEVQRNLP